MMPRRRVRLSFAIAKTWRLLTAFSVLVVLCLGASYLFLLNSVSMKGYRLSKIAEQHMHLLSQEEQLDAKLAHFQTRQYLSDRKQTESMVYREKGNFVVIKETFTAQKGFSLQNNF